MKQKEIYRTATFAWSPTSLLPIIATGTVAGALDESFSNESQLEIWQPDFMQKDQVDLGADVHSSPVGFVTDTSRFNRIAWGQAHRDRSLGVIAAGMENGELALWDPAKIIAHVDASESLVLRNTIHTGPVRGLDFNPVQTNLLSSGAISGEVYIWDLNDPSKPYSPTPGNRSSKLDEITSVAWNHQVQYVLAGASSSGYSVVWDLRGKREVVALAYGGGAGTLGGAVGTGMAVGGRRGMSAIAWHPDNATRLVTASEDDMSPVIMVWDLRNARAPEKILTGHEKGVLSLSWCKQDADLLLSCGKDNRALCWNPQTSEIIGELPSADNWAFQVEWCPRNPDLLATAFFSGTIGIHSLQSTNAVPASVPATPRATGADIFNSPLPVPPDHGLSLSLKQPPRWLRRPVSASFGFGGKLVTVSNLQGVHGKTQSSVVHLRGVVSEENVVTRVKKLKVADEEDKLEVFAQSSMGEQSGAEETWKALLSLFRSNSREELVTLLGYSKEEVKTRIEEAVAKLKQARAQQTTYTTPAFRYTADEEPDSHEPRDPVVSFVDPEPAPEVEATDTEKTGSEMSTSDAPPADGESTTTAPSLFGDDPAIAMFGAGTGADFFTTMAAARAATVGSRPSSVASESLSVKNNTFRIYPADESETDRLVTRALVLGDFGSAVELCLSAERYADALLLAIKGGDDLLQRTQKAYFESQTTQHPYLRLFQSIVTNDLDDVVQNAHLSEWAEVFVVLCTFASGDEFGGLAEQLGARLEFQAGVVLAGNDGPSESVADAMELRKTATLTYLAAGRLERLVNIWTEELAEEEGRRVRNPDPSESTSRYATHAHALQTFIEKVTVFRGAVKYVDGDLSVAAGNTDDAVKTYKLAALYDRYFEYAEMLAAQGLIKEAVEYLRLTPEAYTGNGVASKPVPNRPPSVPVPAVPFQGGGQYAPPQPAYQPAHPVYLPHNTGIPYTPPPHVKPPLGPPPVRPLSGVPPMRAQNAGWNDPPDANKAGRTAGSIGALKREPISQPIPKPNAVPTYTKQSIRGPWSTFTSPTPCECTESSSSASGLATSKVYLYLCSAACTTTSPYWRGTLYVALTGICATRTSTWAIHESHAPSGTSTRPRATAGTIWARDAAAWRTWAWPNPVAARAIRASSVPGSQGSHAPPHPSPHMPPHAPPHPHPHPHAPLQAHPQPGPYGPPPSINQGPPPVRGPPQPQHPIGGMPPQQHGPPPGGPSAAPPPARAPPPPPRGPPPPKYPPGDRTHIPEFAQPIYDVLTEDLNESAWSMTSSVVSIPCLTRSTAETLSKPIVDRLLVLVQAIAAHDRDAALGIHVDLLTRGSQTDDIGLWMTGIKQLIMYL
ncbi:hypothetical protein JVU11DRAFT_8110 [Chiua virens]|nr:hypothetical protein JVU11DRAFT_8110 [Chiua virens]